MALANPATMVMLSNAFARRCGSNQDTTTAKAGSYNTIAEVRPTPMSTAYNWIRLDTCDQARSRPVAEIEPTVIRARAPWRSSHRPTGTAMTAPARIDAVSAPVTVVVEVCNVVAMGRRSTAKA